MISRVSGSSQIAEREWLLMGQRQITWFDESASSQKRAAPEGRLSFPLNASLDASPILPDPTRRGLAAHMPPESSGVPRGNWASRGRDFRPAIQEGMRIGLSYFPPCNPDCGIAEIAEGVGTAGQGPIPCCSLRLVGCVNAAARKQRTSRFRGGKQLLHPTLPSLVKVRQRGKESARLCHPLSPQRGGGPE